MSDDYESDAKCPVDLDSWRRECVAPAYDARNADPARTITIDKVRAMPAIEHRIVITATNSAQ
jgi:hypothetical protein